MQADLRLDQLTEWADSALRARGWSRDTELVPASDDASFRRYFRARCRGNSRGESRGENSRESRIFVDAPPERENSEPFVRIAGILLDGGLNPPVVIAHDLTLGFMMLSDFGTTLYRDRLGTAGEAGLYDDALDALERMQSVATAGIPDYDDALLRREMGLFETWLLTGWLGLGLSKSQKQMLAFTFDTLVASAFVQPAVFVHRDYHCRNLMVTGPSSPGILDFQDAVHGPVTYDLVSLLKDCYWRFDDGRVDDMVRGFRDRLRRAGRVAGDSQAEFRRWFDLMGMQRHIKCAGIFARLSLRDGKPAYLNDIPLALDYLRQASARYPEFDEFGALVGEVAGAFALQQRSANDGSSA